MGHPLPLNDPLPAARDRFAGFLQALTAEARVVVFAHADADGLAAGALLGRGLPRAGLAAVQIVVSRRGESAFSPDAAERLRALEPDALVVVDLGVRPEPILPGVPTMLIDHHRPSGEPPGTVVISGYTWRPIPTSAWLAFELLRSLADVEDLGWLAAVGTLGDLGDRAEWAELPGLKKRYTAKWLREAVTLVNAARRASAFDVETPLRMLLHADHPKAVSEDVALGAERLHAYRAEVNEELRVARRQAPRFSSDSRFALVRIHSACQIHPLIAQQWRSRLPNHAVIAANTGYLPGVVAFSMRTARNDLNLPALLQSLRLGDHEGRFGQGHDRASGGHLPPDRFEELLRRLGFPEKEPRA